MQISGNHVWQGSAVQFLKRKIQVYQSSLRPMATSKPDQNIKSGSSNFEKKQIKSKDLEHIPDDQKDSHLPVRNR